jgi:hypothetical protein
MKNKINNKKKINNENKMTFKIENQIIGMLMVSRKLNKKNQKFLRFYTTKKHSDN